MKLYEIYKRLEELAPSFLSAKWDNDGMMCAPRGDCEISRVLVALDPTEAAIEYASERGCELLVTHHPLIFSGLRRLDGEDTVSSRVLSAILKGISVISLHTRLDAAKGGVNDTLASLLGGEILGSFGDADSPTIGRIVAFGEGISAEELARRVKSATGAPTVRLTGDGTVRVAAVVGGSGKSLTDAAMEYGADALVTGESGYNTAEAGAEQGFVTVEAGHFHTENPICKVLAEKLREQGLEVELFDFCPYRHV